MARSCSVCSHPERASIEKSGASFRLLASQFGLSESSIRRHKNEHVQSNDQSTQETKHIEAVHSNEPTQESTQSVEMQSTQPPVNENELLHREIIAYIQSKLEPELAALYSDAIEQSVSTNCYDYEWKTSAAPYRKIGRYIEVLQADWMQKQGDIQPFVYRVLRLLSFGSEEQKAQLRRLLGLGDIVT